MIKLRAKELVEEIPATHAEKGKKCTLLTQRTGEGNLVVVIGIKRKGEKRAHAVPRLPLMEVVRQGYALFP